jgi:hypothetical protein
MKDLLSYKSRILKISIILGIVFSLGWTFFGKANHAFADSDIPIGNIVPMPNSADVFVDPDNNNPTPNPVATGQPGLAVGDGAFTGNYAWLKVYVPNGQQATVTVQNGAGWCNNVNDLMDTGQAHVIWSLEDLDANENELGAGGTYFQSIDGLAKGAACQNISFPTIQSNQGTSSTLSGHSGYRVFYFIGHIINCPDNNTNCDCPPGAANCNDYGEAKEFRVYAAPAASTAYSFSTSGPLVGLSRSVNAIPNTKTPPGISYENISNTFGAKTDFTYETHFGTYCGESNPNAPLTFFDMDNGLLNPQFLSADVYQDDKSQAGLAWTLQQHYSANQIGTFGVDHSLNNVSFNADALYHYKLYSRRAAWYNTEQFYIPYDQIDANDSLVNCYDSDCSYTVTPAGTLPTNSSFAVTVKMSNQGLVTWIPPDYNLYQTNPANSPTSYGIIGPISTGNTATFNITLSSGFAGTFEYDYQMRNSLGDYFGGVCKINLSWIAITSYNYPYFKIYGGDISAGGAYRHSDSYCDPADIIGPENAGGNKYYGGIRSYANPDSTAGGTPPKGSSVSFAAYALGMIDGTSPPNGAPPYGFYSSAVNPSDISTKTYSALDFANQDILGGLMGGSAMNADAHCIPDYYDETLDIGSVVNNGSVSSYNLDGKNGQQQFIQAGIPLKLSGTTSGKLTVYVNGDAYITNNVLYNSAGWGFDLSNFTNNAPYFALIVKGNIYIDPSVSRLDGLYIAQPLSDGSKGIISTCAPAGIEADATAVSVTCNSQLVFNGAAIAKHFHLLRSYGDVFAATDSETAPINSPNPSNHSAEVINYLPSIVLGQPDFLSLPSKINNLSNLPPVF